MFSSSGNGGDTEYYQTLGLEKGCNQPDIKKAYYKLAKKYHPDKAPSDKKEEFTKRFQEIGEAYEVLSDEEKRKRYDQFGKEGLKGGMDGGFGDPFSMFSQFFGNDIFSGFYHNSRGNNQGRNNRSNNRNNQANRRGGKKKSAAVVHQINLTLEDLFNGRTIKLKITSKRIFKKESNEPSPLEELSETSIGCQECNGVGTKVELRQIAPGLVTQNRRTCSVCLGTGNVLSEDYELKDHSQLVKVEVKIGMDYREEKIIPGAGNCYPGTIPGDIIISFHLLPHSVFKLRSNNLVINKKIELWEALCGTQFCVKELDGNSLKIKSKGIIKPGDTRVIKEKGMYDKFGLRGDLIIDFEIVFPKKLTTHQRKNIKKFLPKSSSGNTNDSNSNNNKENDEENGTEEIII